MLPLLCAYRTRKLLYLHPPNTHPDTYKKKKWAVLRQMYTNEKIRYLQSNVNRSTEIHTRELTKRMCDFYVKHGGSNFTKFNNFFFLKVSSFTDGRNIFFLQRLATLQHESFWKLSFECCLYRMGSSIYSRPDIRTQVYFSWRNF